MALLNQTESRDALFDIQDMLTADNTKKYHEETADYIIRQTMKQLIPRRNTINHENTRNHEPPRKTRQTTKKHEKHGTWNTKNHETRPRQNTKTQNHETPRKTRQATKKHDKKKILVNT